MTTTLRPEEVRHLVLRTFQGFGIAPAVLEELDEHLLIEGGKFRARSYRAAGFLAMWLVSAGVLQFYDPQGNMLQTINLLEEMQPLPAAA